MRNTLKLHLYGYTVRGVDRRDGSDFEDYIVVSNMDGEKPTERMKKIVDLYSGQGYEVNSKDLQPDDEFENNCWKKSLGVQIELDIGELYRQNRVSAE